MRRVGRICIIGILSLCVVIAWHSNTMAAGWHPTKARHVQRVSTEAASSTQVEREADPLLERLDRAIEITRKRQLSADVHSPWQIFHGVVAFGRDFQLRKADTTISAIDWMAAGATYDGEPLVEVAEPGGRFHPYSRPYAFEGHANQFLALLTSCKLPKDFAFQTNGRQVTIADMLEYAKSHARSDEEISFTLWALSYYLEPDAEWKNAWGQQWSIERLVRMQIGEDLSYAACGGTHGLFALTIARDRYVKSHDTLSGAWLEADQRINQYIEIARSLQNSDGSFSDNHFEGPGYANHVVARLTSSGHTLEWLALALPNERLEEPWVRRGVDAVVRDLIDTRTRPIQCGPLYHSTHALILYRGRIEALRERASTSVAVSQSDTEHE